MDLIRYYYKAETKNELIDDIKGGNFERKPKKEKKEFITFIISKFESKRLSFNENNDYNGYSPKDE